MTIVEEALLEMDHYPDLRLGQAVYNIAIERDPSARILCGTEVDPFYDDSRVDAFLKKLEELASR